MNKNGVVYIYIYVYNSIIKMNKIMSFSATSIDLENIIVSEILDRERQVIYVECKKIIQINLFTE